MEEMLCSPTVSSNSNVWMLYLCANDSDASSFKSQNATGLFCMLLDGIIMARCEKPQVTSNKMTGDKGEAISDEFFLSQSRSEAGKTKNDTIEWDLAMMDPALVMQSIQDVQAVRDVLNKKPDVDGFLNEPVGSGNIVVSDVKEFGTETNAKIYPHEIRRNEPNGLDTILIKYGEKWNSGYRKETDGYDVVVGKINQNEQNPSISVAAGPMLSEEDIEVENWVSHNVFINEQPEQAFELSIGTFEGSELKEAYGDAPFEPQKTTGFEFLGKQQGDAPNQKQDSKGFSDDAGEVQKPVRASGKTNINIEHQSTVVSGNVNQVNDREWLPLSGADGRSHGQVHEKTVPEQIVESVRYFKFDDVKEFEIELVPKELGRVRIRVATDGEKVNVHLVAENLSVAETIRAELPVLKDLLAHEGLTFGYVDVGVGQEGDTRDNMKHPNSARLAYSVKRLEHSVENDVSYSLNKNDAYLTRAGTQVDYVA